MLKTTKIDKKRLPIRTDVRAGFDWHDLWSDVKEVGNDIGDGVREANDATKAAIHRATAPN